MEQQNEQLQTVLNAEPTGSSELASQGSSALPAVPAAGPFEKARPPYVQIADVDGILWNIRETRPTKHGFNILFGYPAKPLIRKQRGCVGKFRLIVTRELVAYWEAHYKEEGAIYDIPVSRKVIDLASRRVCFNMEIEHRRSIRRRRTLLPELPSIREFARRYGVSLEDAEEWHMFLLDPTPRSHHWWRDPAPLAVLLSSATLSEAAVTLGISSASASRLRRRAFALDKTKSAATPRKLVRAS